MLEKDKNESLINITNNPGTVLKSFYVNSEKIREVFELSSLLKEEVSYEIVIKNMTFDQSVDLSKIINEYIENLNELFNRNKTTKLEKETEDNNE